MKFRIEKTPWVKCKFQQINIGAQTERSRNNFKIGPSASCQRKLLKVYLKKAAAYANCDLGVLPQEKKRCNRCRV
jgi:fumarate hydratase class II